eukprot:TRINITY_DN1950_c0_g2_i4.p1 TRINITY_DN1950_c0_g2~~TRINITY_DN1950_c0_g2_i4.p1  ORF type:complete len:2116 (+),score=782.76 TRINITY_DN1950_c0_g2_i4:269-6616(+)
MLGLTEGTTLEKCESVNVFDSDTTSMLGGSYSCTWTTPRVLVIAYQESNTIDSGSMLTLRGGEIRSTTTSILFSSGSESIVLRTAAPEVVEARVSDLGSEVTISLSGSLYPQFGNDDGLVACNKVFSNSLAMLGVGSLCRIDFSDKTINADLKPSGSLLFLETIIPANPCPTQYSLRFIEGIIRPIKDSMSSVTGCIAVQMPSNPTTPEVVLTSPRSVGACEDLKLTAQTSGAGVRALTVSWIVSSSNAADEMVTNIQALLTTASNNGKTTVVIPQTLISSSTQDDYSFTVSVTNFADLSASDTKSVTKSSLALPTIGSKQLSSSTMKRSDEKTISVTATPPKCGTSSKLTYVWSLDSGILPNGIEFDSFKSASPNAISFSGTKLKPLETYTFTITVSMNVAGSDDVVSNSESFVVEMVLSELTVPMSMNQIVGSSHDINIVSAVTDPDELTTPFTIAWECSLTDGTTATDCMMADGMTPFVSSDYVALSGDDTSDPTGSSMVIPPSQLPANEEGFHYKFTMTATKGGRSASTDYEITIVSTNIPTVGFVNIRPTISDASPLGTQNKLIVEAGVTSDDPGTLTYVWSLDGDVAIADVVSGYVDRAKLIIRSNSLTPGSNYVLTCTVTDSNGEGSSTLNFRTNSAPSGGYLTNEGVSEGNESSTMFTILTTGWNDVDTPLSFKFVAVSTSTEIESIFQGYSSSSYAENTLNRGEYYFKVYVKDKYGAESSSTLNASGTTIVVSVKGTVIPDGRNRAEYIYEQQSSLLEEATNSGDASQIFSVGQSMVQSFIDPCSNVICIQGYSSSSYAENTLNRGEYYFKVYVKDKYGAESSSTLNASGTTIVVSVKGTVIPDGRNRAEYIYEQQSSLLEEATNSGDASQIFSVGQSMVQSFIDPCSNVICIQGSCNSDTGICDCTDNYTGSDCSTPPAIDGGVSEEWSEWGECSASCGGGIQIATKSCDNPVPQYGGAECAVADLTKEQACNTEACTVVIDGGYSDWIADACVADCSTLPSGGQLEGSQVFTRTCTNPAPSTDGKSCAWIGASTKTESCTITCENTIPPKSCPGSKYDDITKSFFIECNGQGTCTRTKKDVSVTESECLENDVLCLAKCECNTDYTGRGCGKSTAEIAQLKENSKNILQNIKDVSGQVSSDNLSDNADTLASIASDADILDSEGAAMVTSIITNMLSGSGVTSLDTDVSTKLLESADSVLSSQFDAGENVTDVIAAVGNIIDSVLMGMEAGEETSIMETDNLLMGVQVRDSTELLEEFVVTNSYGEKTSGLALPDDMISSLTSRRRLAESPTAIQIKNIQWAENPNGVGTGTADIGSQVTSVSLADQNGNEIDVSGLGSPIEFSFTIGHTNVEEVECTYYDPSTDIWSSKGMMLVGLEVGASSMVATCATIHLTDLAAKSDSPMPAMNTVDPIGDADLLLQYNWSNATPIFVLGGITLLFASFCLFSAYNQKRQKAKLVALQQQQFLKYGQMRPIETKMKESPVERVSDGFKNEHSWGSFVAAPLGEQIALTRTQRLAVVIAVTYTAIAINAAFYGAESMSFEQEILTVVISVLSCLPASMLFPMMFRKVNAYRSKTLEERAKKKKEVKKMNRLKKLFRRGGKKKGKKYAKVSPKDVVVAEEVEVEKAENPLAAKKAEEFDEIVRDDDTDTTPVRVLTTEGKGSRGAVDMLFTQTPAGGNHVQNAGDMGTSTESSSKCLGDDTKTKMNNAIISMEAQSPNHPNNNNDISHDEGGLPSKKFTMANVVEDEIVFAATSKDTGSSYSESEIRSYQLRFLIVTLAMLVLGLIGFVISLIKILSEDFGVEFYVIQAILCFALIGMCVFGLVAFKKKSKGKVEVYTVLALLFVLLLTFFSVVVISVNEVRIMEVSVQEVLRLAWKTIYNDAEASANSKSILEDYQTDNNCCGFMDMTNKPILPCPTTATDGCRDKLMDDFQTLNIWFVIFCAIVVLLLGAIVHLGTILRKILKEAQVIAIDLNDVVVEKAALKLQAAFRGWQGRTRAVRKREVDAWSQLHVQRLIMTSLVYMIVSCYCIFMLYINLLYGIKFSGSIVESWLKASVASILIDICLQQPLLIIGKALLAPMFVTLYEQVIGRIASFLENLTG